MNSTMKKGFTLAEVLITLAIIGVVAALTIPSVIIKNQKQELYTRFIRLYSDLSRLLPVMINERGSTSNWTQEDCESIASNYMKASKICEAGRDCFAAIYSLTPNGNHDNFPTRAYNNLPSFELSTGAVINIKFQRELTNTETPVGCYIIIDTNGKKGPNAAGRDYFEFYFVNNKLSVNMSGNNDILKKRSTENLEKYCYGTRASLVDSLQNCAMLLLREKKMDY